MSFSIIIRKAKSLASESVDSITSSIDSIKNVVVAKEEKPQEEILTEQLEGETQDVASIIEEIDKLQEKVIQYLAENSEKLKQWYSDNQINEKITNVAKKAGGIIIYPVLLLYNILKSPQTAVQDKMFIIAPLAYFILPADIIPDFIAALGYADDGIAVTKSLQTVSSSITPTMQEDAKLQCEGIFGEMDEELLDQISGIINDNQGTIVSFFVSKNNKIKKNSTPKK